MNLHDLHSENQLLAGISKGDQRCFKVLVDKYWQKIFGHALAYCHSVPHAEEITQDIFTTIWTKRTELPGLENFSNYLFIVTRNKIIKEIRKKLAKTETVETLSIPEGLLRPDKQLEYKELNKMFLDAMELLPPARKRVFMMCKTQGMSYDEVADTLKLSRNTVKEHMVKALNFLRTYFAVKDGE